MPFAVRIFQGGYATAGSCGFAINEHFRQVSPAHRIFSMPLPEGAFQLLQVALRRASADLDLEALTDVGEAASAHPDGVLGQIGNHVFWSLVSSGPQRIICPDTAVTADMKGRHVVNVHECWYLADDGMTAGSARRQHTCGFPQASLVEAPRQASESPLLRATACLR